MAESEIETTGRQGLLGSPRGVVLAVGWLAAVPWIVFAVRGIWGAELIDGFTYPLAFWVTLPAWLAVIAGARPARPIAAAVAYAAVATVPLIVLALLAIARGVLTTDLLQVFARVWAVSTITGVALWWLGAEVVVRAVRWNGRGVVGRIWSWEQERWWSASLGVIAVGALAAPVLFLLSDALTAGAVVTTIVAGVLLNFVIEVGDVDWWMVALEVVLSLPVLITSVVMRDVNLIVVVVLGVAAAVAFAAIAQRHSLQASGRAIDGPVVPA